MPNQLQVDYLTGKTLYALIRAPDGSTIWNQNTGLFEIYNAANYVNYAEPLTEQSVTGYYLGNFPPVAADLFNVLAKLQIGVNPAESDTTVGTGTIIWDGSKIQDVSSIFNAMMKTDIGSSDIQDNSAVHSLTTALMKLLSKFDAKTGQTFKLDGTTVKMTQAVTTDATLVPIRSLGVGS